MELSFRDFVQRYDRPIFQLSGGGAPMPITGLRPRQLGPLESFEDVHERRWLSDAPGHAIPHQDRLPAIRQIGSAAKPVMASASPRMVIPEGKPNPAAPVQIDNLLF
ncbi:hypothetical protein TSTA_123790 [Talaromyces stipitatus ATCC 10500]|uniref:Uncharacterized protein n=1 Tax=Talaromyces stipitatus (strain ATCC 10500 / CBS 375.48 / QM 6759 / NRRL 1006) TaxID=441959 RepID=B8MAE8_TALSN|nr:uncharacterized protein TSTA_123790 [Talaromyces stipitatus ATCC 10500]EED18650.1 hypothetical protein TSTA_123790 [Talaromyces stipitatus ATCC 10500]